MENAEVKLELAEVLTDKKYIDEFEAVLRKYLAEMIRNKQLLCLECGAKCKTERLQMRNFNHTHTSCQILFSKDDLKQLMEDIEIR